MALAGGSRGFDHGSCGDELWGGGGEEHRAGTAAGLARSLFVLDVVWGVDN